MQDVFINLGIALGLGLLVGLQRERAESRMAGIRTFPLITLFGTICGTMADRYGAWIVAAGIVGIAILALTSNLVRVQSKETPDPGQTTEAAALLMFCVGAYLAGGGRATAVAVGGTVAVLLYLKEPLREIAGRITETELRAVMQFVVISLVVLPVLPNRTFGPYDVLNPRQIWLMVLLTVGISIAGYAAYKLFGEKAGALLGGVLGGVISSTATTMSYARITKRSSRASALAAVVIMVASTIAFLRIIVEIAVVAPSAARTMVPPLAAMLVLMGIVSAAAYFLDHAEKQAMPEQDNPAAFKSALLFGGLYALVLFAVAAVKSHFGNRALYAVAAFSGLTDMDAITLSTANLAVQGRVDPATGWRVVFIASLSNLAFKGLLVAAAGDRNLLVRIALLFGIALVGGGLLLWFWPG